MSLCNITRPKNQWNEYFIPKDRLLVLHKIIPVYALALFASQCLKPLGFAKLMEELILAGGDTDTIASITGQITGAIIGEDGLPEEWKAKLPDREMIFGIAGEFASIVLERFSSTSVY